MKLRPGTSANPEIWSAKGYEFILKKDYGNVGHLSLLLDV